MICLRKTAQKNCDRLNGKARIAPYLADLLIVPWLLSEEHLFAYLCAKMISLGIPVSLVVLERRLGGHLAFLAEDELQAPFRAAAARVNLSYLMVSGALAIISLSVAHRVFGHLPELDASFGEVVIWLVVGQSTAVLFGASTLLMSSVGQRRLCDLIRIITLLVFLCCVWIVGPRTGVLIAQMLAVAKITHAAVCAIFLAKYGVWPGLTALFHKEIKIFS